MNLWSRVAAVAALLFTNAPPRREADRPEVPAPAPNPVMRAAPATERRKRSERRRHLQRGRAPGVRKYPANGHRP